MEQVSRIASRAGAFGGLAYAAIIGQSWLMSGKIRCPRKALPSQSDVNLA
jgi:hypothetical protein